MDEEFCRRVDGEWSKWIQERAEAKNWFLAMPLISLEMYFHRRLLDCCGYFGDVSCQDEGENERVLVDPFQAMKLEALDSALGSGAFKISLAQHLAHVRPLRAGLRALWSEDSQDRTRFYRALGSSSLPDFFESLRKHVASALKSSLWGNRGDLALAPGDRTNTQEASRIDASRDAHGRADKHMLVDDSEAIFEHLVDVGKKRGSAETAIDIILDNSGIELLCDLMLADLVLAYGLAAQVRLHAKGEPLFLSDAMPRDIASHVGAMEASEDADVRELGGRVRSWIDSGDLRVVSHQFWTVRPCRHGHVSFPREGRPWNRTHSAIHARAHLVQRCAEGGALVEHEGAQCQRGGPADAREEDQQERQQQHEEEEEALASAIVYPCACI
jgi:hypothetical protein